MRKRKKKRDREKQKYYRKIERSQRRIETFKFNDRMSRAKECETLLLSLVKRSWRKKKAIIKQRRKKSERIIKEE